jgi:hypothetical protein
MDVSLVGSPATRNRTKEVTVAFGPANHYVISGKGINAVVDTAGTAGAPIVSLGVDDRSISDPAFRTTSHGIVIDGIVDVVPDSHTVEICLTFPEVNLSEEQVTFSGFATVTRALTSIGGPRLLAGALHLYELRPVAGTASCVAS